MKVVCIQDVENILTFGKIYDVVDSIDLWYYIKSDKGHLTPCHKDRFKLLSDIRNERINQIL